MKKTSYLLFGLLLVGLAACGGEGTTVNEELICVAGNTKECDCPDSEEKGLQVCSAEGTAWSACQSCPEVPEEIVPEPEDVTEPEEVVEPPEEIVEPPEDVKKPLVCLLNNCKSDDHCNGCSDGRTICLVEENRCVACNPNTQQGCKEDEECNGFGICVPKGLTCPTDDKGQPKVVCLKNADCMACSPMHQVCDITTKKCQACTKTNTGHCQQNEICKDGKCAPKCPQSCNIDNDCMFCGPDDEPAHACNNHKCSECSPTWPCPAGLICLANGVCYPPCGLPGPVSGTCLADEDCKYCGDPKNPGTFDCKKAVNDPEGHGKCIPPAEGCSDLGKGVAVLPEPWNQYTELCSADKDCENIEIELNVGKLIRKAIGADEVMGVPIGDATVGYAMHECAEIKLTQNINCGICVPCDEDSDCAPIPVDPLIMDLFSGNALAYIAGAVLIDMLYGGNPEHNLNLYCQPVGLGYGVCAPCGNPLQPCGKTTPEPGTGSCDHDTCTEGTALDPSCGACATAVCSHDAYCCTTAWDALCVQLVDQYCTTPCGGTTTGCAPDICDNDALPAQDPFCGGCVAAVCEVDPFCCNKQSGSWDKYCVTATEELDACDLFCGGLACPHSECETGGPLPDGCSDCVTSVCSYDAWCCENEWDSYCVDEAKEDLACDC